MEWRLAKALETLRKQVNAKWPERSKDSDGSVGDARHQAESSSDHNPWIADPLGPHVVSAIDITHDPAHGFNSYTFADMLLAKQDPRLKYVISNRRIGSGPAGPQAGKWRKYSGSNAHDHHVHVSVMSDKRHFDDTKDWDISGIKEPVEAPVVVKTHPTLRPDSTGDDVKFLQEKIGGLTVDGVYGPLTVKKVQRLQAQRGLVEDGICGPATWAVILE